MITKTKLIADFKELNLNKGDFVFFHSSLRSLGQVDGGADTVIDALLETIGSAGTLAAPAIIHTSGLPRADFKLATSPSEVGKITEVLRLRPNAVRSYHSTHSVAAIGKRAEEFTQGHTKANGVWTPWGRQAFGLNSPWDLLYKWNVKYVFLGVDTNVATILHYAQTRYLHKYQKSFAEAIPFPSFDLVKMGNMIKTHCKFVEGKAGEAKVMIFQTKNIVDQTLKILDENPKGLFSKAHPFTKWQKNMNSKPSFLEAGVAKVALNIPGWKTTKEKTGLFARVLYIKDNNTSVAIVSLTLLALAKQDMTTLRQYISEILEIPAENVFISCTHVHSGPPTLDMAEKPGVEFLDSLIQAVTKAARKAKRQLQAVRIGSVKKQLKGVSINRRLKMNDGKVYTLRRAVPSTWNFKDKTEFIDFENKLDTDFTLLKIENLKREPLGCLYHFPCHPVIDFFGYASEKLEDFYADNGFVCIPIKGASGDIDTPFQTEILGRYADEQLKPIGDIHFAALVESMSRTKVKDFACIHISHKKIKLPVHSQVLKERCHDPKAFIRQIAASRTVSSQLTSIKLGDMQLVGVPGELSSASGAKIKALLKNCHVCPVDLVNDMYGYIFPEEAHKNGGYEVNPECWGLLAPKAEAILINAIDLILKNCSEKVGKK